MGQCHPKAAKQGCEPGRPPSGSAYTCAVGTPVGNLVPDRHVQHHGGHHRDCTQSSNGPGLHGESLNGITRCSPPAGSAASSRPAAAVKALQVLCIRQLGSRAQPLSSRWCSCCPSALQGTLRGGCIHHQGVAHWWTAPRPLRCSRRSCRPPRGWCSPRAGEGRHTGAVAGRRSGPRTPRRSRLCPGPPCRQRLRWLTARS